MQNLVVQLFLVIAGVGAIVAGVLTWRSAEKLVTDARQNLQAMFGDNFPGLFEGEPEPRGAQIAGVGFAIAGVALLAVAAFRLFAT